MGIKDLWSILQPYCERKPLFELQGKRVAIDLSGWVCQAQNIAEYQVQPNMYLRNLYFRTVFLLLSDVQMVFVLEGKAPTLKYKTIAARNELQFKGAAPRSQRVDKAGVKQKGGRSRFDHTLKQCKEMLRLMGLACVTGEGEAEAMCAHLNKNKLVEGCISQDSDCFAYGADTVYRNFSISMQGAQASSGGSIDVYDLKKSLQEMDFGRNKVIALALLCGSDYNEGVHGIGKESALRYFATISERLILKEIRSWRTNTSHYETLNNTVNDKRKCTSCSHTGKKAAHTKFGCLTCRTAKGCNPNEDHANIKLCLQLREKSLQDDGFPDEELIGEFLNEKDKVTRVDLEWKMPDLPAFIEFTRRYLQWEEIYAFQKLFPILTRWLVHNPTEISSKNVITTPARIKKNRARKGIPCYEVIWKFDKLLPLIPSEQITLSHEEIFSSIEPKHLVDQSLPLLVSAFEESLKPKDKKPKKAKTLKPSKTIKSQRKINEIFNKNENKTFDDSLFDDVDNEADLSLIVEEICAKGVPKIFTNKMKQLITKDVCAASFYDLNMTEKQIDAFEQSMFMLDDVDDEISEDDDEN